MEKSKKVNKNFVSKIVIALIAAIIIFIILNVVQTSISYPNGKTTLYIAKEDIKNEEVTEDDFEKINEDAKLKSSNAITDISNVIGKKAKEIKKGEIITEDDFEDKDAISKSYCNPVEIAVNTKDIANSVAGTVSSGDRINIYATDSTTKETKMILNDIYVNNSFSDGNATDSKQAVLFTVLVEGQDSIKYINAANNGQITIEKIIK